MGPNSRADAAEHDLFRMERVNPIDRRHEPVKPVSLIDSSSSGAMSSTCCSRCAPRRLSASPRGKVRTP
jgi:hypothetical protein